MQDYKKKSVRLFQGLLSEEALQKVKLGRHEHAFVCEGRPSLESGRKTSARLLKRGITPTVIADNMPGFLFSKGLVKGVHLACQYADNKGALCDTGALILAVLAKKHKVHVLLSSGEKRYRFLGDPQDILNFEKRRTAPKGARGYVPLVEWVPAKYLK